MLSSESTVILEHRWLRTGDEAYAAMLGAIAVARVAIRLEMYIFAPGAPGDQFRQALVAAAQLGVHVKVMVDSFGSFNLAAQSWDALIRCGGEFRWFNPLAWRRFGFRRRGGKWRGPLMSAKRRS